MGLEWNNSRNKEFIFQQYLFKAHIKQKHAFLQ